MPQRKEPAKLYDMCVKHIERLVHFSCVKLKDEYGSYHNHQCLAILKQLQQYLTDNIPAPILDEICEQRKFKYSLRSDEKDARFKLFVYMHPNMTSFTVDSSSVLECKLPISDRFWETQLQQMNKLVVLELHLVCTDEILEVVGNSCPLLEEIDIVSRIENDSRGPKSLVNFNALKLKFFVSDIGLQHLCKCQRLRRIKMNKMIRSQYGGKMMTHEGIRTVIRSLKRLEYINYGDLGEVLSTGMYDINGLALETLFDCHPDSEHIFTFTKLCPRLRNLSLTMPDTGEDNGGSLQILDGLADSALQLCLLELRGFEFQSSMLHVFETKGQFITSLQVYATNMLNSKHVQIIGLTCPNLQNLHLRRLGPEDNGGTHSFSHLPVTNSTHPTFLKLQCLLLSGREWDYKILRMTLSHAQHLTSLQLMNQGVNVTVDEALKNILTTNSLPNLQFLHLLCDISFTVLHHLVKTCEYLRSVNVKSHDGLKAADIEVLHEEYVRKNYDIQIVFVLADGARADV